MTVWPVDLSSSLLRASIEGALLAVGVWSLCRVVPRLPAAVRCGLWWLVCLRLVLGLAAWRPVELPLLPAPPAPKAVAVTETAPRATVVLPAPRGVAAPAMTRIAAPPPAETVRIPWLGLIGVLWLAGLLVQGVRTALQLRQARGLVRRSEPVPDPGVVELFAGLRRELGVRAAEVRVSPEVRTPQVVGLLRPVVLLPKSASLSRGDLAMALCHELLHVRRGDLWWGWVPALAQRLFWFHPLAGLAVREYALAREAACDEGVLRVLEPAPEAYGRLLLRLGVTPRATSLAAAGAAPSFRILKRRLEMLEQSSVPKRSRLGAWCLVALIAPLGLVPFRIVAQEAPPAPPAPPTPVVAPAPPAAAPAIPAAPAPPAPVVAPGAAPAAAPAVAPAPAAPATPAAPVAPVAAPAPPSPIAAPAPAPALAPAAEAPDMPTPAPAPALAPTPVARIAGMTPPPPPPPPAPKAPKAPKAPQASSGYFYFYNTGGDAFVLLNSDSSATMSGSTGDIHRAKELRTKNGERLLYFKHGSREYVVRDPEVLKQAEALFEPQRKLGAQQAELGARQADLGAKQAALGAQQAGLGARQAALAADQARRSGDGKDDADLEQKQADLSRQQDELGRQQDALGRQQDGLGHQQDELGRQQERLAGEAEKKLATLMDQLIASGKAQEVH
jgi:beta-lactamase regulating signal transducer with metallopeptidase domain